ncbi:unnamed protein product [Cladocopium goreaui]|uniref:Cilia- and flagella-associated protein 157 (Flagellar-associated protein 77) n=1 Tax=Cladocopium goreaui TaxID=2562237 RepID=A0A9P1FM39_9DINO|nr:unnamed protein product [Cladocopium goreaui]CAI4016150.1 unnamed protein product [Cladocopium goreaui]
MDHIEFKVPAGCYTEASVKELRAFLSCTHRKIGEGSLLWRVRLQLADMKEEFQRKMSDFDRKKAMDMRTLSKDFEKKVEIEAAKLRARTKDQLDSTTKRTIMENEQMVGRQLEVVAAGVLEKFGAYGIRLVKKYTRCWCTAPGPLLQCGRGGGISDAKGEDLPGKGPSVHQGDLTGISRPSLVLVGRLATKTTMYFIINHIFYHIHILIPF